MLSVTVEGGTVFQFTAKQEIHVLSRGNDLQPQLARGTAEEVAFRGDFLVVDFPSSLMVLQIRSVYEFEMEAGSAS